MAESKKDYQLNIKPDAVSHGLLMKLFNTVSEGVFAVDSEFRIIAINDSALETLATTRAKVIGRRCRDVMQATLCSDNCALRQTLKTGDPVVNIGAQIKDNLGRRIAVTLSTTILRDDNGEIIGGVESFVNLAKVKQYISHADHAQPFQDIITGDPTMKQLFEILPTISCSDTSVLIQGETGTGKNLIAKAIHNLSPRAKGPFITVNCAALPETLLESELFGYKAGAFTGASRDKPGRFAAAQGGTLFLDEVGDIPIDMQVKLLRVLQEKVYERLGEQKPIPCDIRFITATHRDLNDMVSQNTFRRDLFYRINVLNIEIPPLRERKGDVPLLAQRFIERLSISRGKHITGVSSAVLERLMSHNYPGNVRELENIIEHAWVMCNDTIIDVENMPRRLRIKSPLGAGSKKVGFTQLEAAYILQVLERHGWHREKAAVELKMHRTTLQRKMKKLGIVAPRKDGRFHS